MINHYFYIIWHALQHWLLFAFWRVWTPIWDSLGFFWSLFLFPYTWLRAASGDRRWRDLFYGIPGLIAIVASAYLMQCFSQQAITLSQIYWRAAQVSLAEKKYDQAEMFLDRVLHENGPHTRDARYDLAMLLEETGRQSRAEVIFASLAPDNARGYPEAHLRLALILSESITDKSAPAELDRLRWHLRAAPDQTSPELSLAWGRFYVAIRDLSAALGHLEKAAAKFPELWATIGEINIRLGSSDRALVAFNRAGKYFTSQLKNTTEGGAKIRSTREDYATVLIRMGKLDEAKVVLTDGLRDDPDGDWHRLIAALYVMYHDVMSAQGGHEISELLVPIAQSLDHEPNFGPALNRLMAYATAQVDGNVELKSVLARVVAEAKQPALAHLALGNLCWIEDDTSGAVFHFERALAMNPKLGVVLNNLAWLVSHASENPDYHRALAMVNSALQEDPANPAFIDTRGTIYLRMKNYSEALNDLERAISMKQEENSVKGRAEIHAKLALVYEKLGRQEMAEQHRILEQQEREKKDEQNQKLEIPTAGAPQ